MRPLPTIDNARTNDPYLFRGETDLEEWQLRIRYANTQGHPAHAWLCRGSGEEGHRLTLMELEDLSALILAGVAEARKRREERPKT